VTIRPAAARWRGEVMWQALRHVGDQKAGAHLRRQHGGQAAGTIAHRRGIPSLAEPVWNVGSIGVVGQGIVCAQVFFLLYGNNSSQHGTVSGKGRTLGAVQFGMAPFRDNAEGDGATLYD